MLYCGFDSGTDDADGKRSERRWRRTEDKRIGDDSVIPAVDDTFEGDDCDEVDYDDYDDDDAGGSCSFKVLCVLVTAGVMLGICVITSIVQKK